MGLLGPELKTSLQFAISAMYKIPNMLKENAELLVEGDQGLIRISTGDPSLRCVVFHGHEGMRLHQTIQFRRELCKKDLHEAFFHGHDCPHDTSCRSQAMNVLFPGHKPLEIKIVCKELRITFSDPDPVQAIMVPYRK